MPSDPTERKDVKPLSWQERLIEDMAADRQGFGTEDANGFREIPTQKGDRNDNRK